MNLANHIVNPVNEQLLITVRDEPGAGGAHHFYEITGFDTETNPSSPNSAGDTVSFGRLVVMFQNGPIGEVGVNGVTHEALLAILEHRLACFQAGPYACEENQEALDYVRLALAILKQRTVKRMARGVEGQSKL